MFQNFRQLGRATALLALALLTTGAARATSPARTETLAVGPYIVDVDLSQDPPYVDTPLEVIVVPHTSSPQLQGVVTAQPGLGTDATPLRTPLVATGNRQGALQGTIRMPVRGAWDLLINLTGPEGAGTGQVSVTVAAPGAIPFWLGWLIGASPLSLIAFWIWRQHRYKRSLLERAGEASLAERETNQRDRQV